MAWKATDLVYHKGRPFQKGTVPPDDFVPTQNQRRHVVEVKAKKPAAKKG